MAIGYNDGRLLIHLHFQKPSRWMHRRVERVDFISDNLCRHHVSLDFDVQRASVVQVARTAGWMPTSLLLPLGLMAKDPPLTSFDLRDDAGVSRPLLTSQETAEAAHQALRYVASKILQPQVLSDASRRTLWDIVSRPASEAESALKGWYDPTTHTYAAGSEESRLMGDAAFKLIVSELVDNYIALTPIDPTTTRQLLKYSYVSDVPWEAPRLVDRIFGTSARFTFPVAAGASYSYHFELAAPENSDVRRLALSEVAGDPPSAANAKNLMRVDGRREQMHVYAHEADRSANHAVVVDLVPQRRGLVRYAWFGALYASVALVSGYLWQLFTRRLEDANVEALGAALLLVPALIAVYVSRPGEHGMAARFAFGARVAMVLAAAAAVLGSIALALGFKGLALANFWLGSSIGAVLPTLYLWYVYRRSGEVIDYETTRG
ncbi:hypothetical protein GCU56_20440 [Geodermatophilus sabuli]|uniref:Uncharacterized protein n=1 Tax=Geodermatophilus sabuli TaxID=1564158 RepID=A0A7K3W688_9ACTN|nr:hypothetical protein [Geodermatophilus sabuli]NEK60230.1 hypothetical protein [Geodermatophilus sabuli]